MHKILLIMTILTLGLAGCSKSKSSSVSQPAGEGTFDPAPATAERSTIEAQLLRYNGQTEFLNPQGWYPTGRHFGRGGGGLERAAAEGGQREVQEADIFKVGKPGSDLLFLLNNYRGLQVVSYSDGADSPRLVGRVAPSGNWPDDMYYDQDGDRLIVLERLWYDESGEYTNYSELQSRVVIYDVSNPKEPKIVKTHEVKGSLAESRMVGDVLYVASSVRPSYSSQIAGEKGSGFVTSFKVEGESVTKIDEVKLSLPISYSENMNIIEEKVGDEYRYYLTAILTDSGWGWWSRKSMVEVIDITDSAGDIEPLMLVSTKGFVRERSQTTVKDGTLIVASNYRVEPSNILRVAVETFILPTETSEVIDQDEADFRHANIDRELKIKRKKLVAAGVTGDQLEDQLDAYLEVLVSDKDLGVKGRFIEKSKDAALEKVLADSKTTIGSTQGLSASLQDVRFDDDLLYVYWVPSNNIDPLDVFDISAPQVGVPHLAHLEFDGWIQRAIPLTYQGKKFIVGLGWVIPSVNNERQRRFPQAMLFSLTKTGNTLKAVPESQLTIGDTGLWANFNASDRFIEVKRNADGTGAIMFAFSSWNEGKYLSGAKLIGFDLNQPDAAFAEGAILEAQEGWLRRVFTNEEIDRVNTFNDQALGTFKLDGAIGAANSIVAASNTLELARNIQAYTTLTKGSKTFGLQIISESNYWGAGASHTELRLTGIKNADAEGSKVKSTISLNGSYIAHAVDTAGSLLILTQVSERKPTTNNNFTYETKSLLHRVELKSSKLLLQGKTEWLVDNSLVTTMPRIGFMQGILTLNNGKILVSSGYSVKLVQVSANGISVADVTLNSCGLEGSERGSLKLLDGDLYLTYGVMVDDPNHEKVQYIRNFISKIGQSGAETNYVCNTPVNIPGQPVSTDAGSYLITEDTRLIDLVERQSGDNTYFETVTENTLASLDLGTSGKAKLVDLYDPQNVSTSSMHELADGSLVFIENKSVESYYPMRGGLMGWPRMPATTADQRLSVIKLDQDLLFTKSSYKLDLKAKDGSNILGIFPDSRKAGDYLAVVGQGRILQVLGLGLSYDRPELQNLQLVEADGSRAETSKVAVLNSSFWYWGGDNGKLNHTASQNSFELSQGYYGVSQLFVK
jgi:hypothetical protein